MKSSEFKSLLPFIFLCTTLQNVGIVTLTSSTVFGAETPEEIHGNITRFSEHYITNLKYVKSVHYNSKQDTNLTEYDKICKRLPLIANAFQKAGLMPQLVLDSGQNQVEVFVILPENYLTFVNSKDQVPRSGAINRMHGMRNRATHCDYTKIFHYSDKLGFDDEVITSGFDSLSAQNISMTLWSYKDNEKKKILSAPTSTIFHIEILRIENQMEILKKELEKFISNKLKSGFYVVAPEGVEQIDWQKDSQTIEDFYKQNTQYKYKWERSPPVGCYEN